MYTIDTMVKHRSAKRTTKRSAKRAAKRGAYKSKRTHRKMKLSRKRMQRGGQSFAEKMAARLAAGTSILKEGVTDLTNKASEFKQTKFDPKAAALKERVTANFTKNPGNSSPSSTPDLGNGGVIQESIQPTDEEKKAALIAANIEANKSYDAAVEVRNAAKSKISPGIQNAAAKKEFTDAQTATSTAYQVALNAVKAAIDGGVPEKEVIIPIVLT